MRELRSLLVNHRDDVPLDVAALQAGTIEYPGLEIGMFLELLDSHARELHQIAGRRLSGEQWVKRANHYLYEVLGFTGNQADYYNSRNSCLSEVLLGRTGIPITLAVVYMEIARRMERPVYGISLPGHFLVKYDDGDYSTFIDCFHRGRLLEPEECRELALRAANVDIGEGLTALQPATKRQILVRILNNFRSVYYRSKEIEKAVQVLNLLIESAPDAAEEYKQRGVLRMALREPREALTDLETYLRLAPRASDRVEITGHVDNLRRMLKLPVSGR